MLSVSHRIESPWNPHNTMSLIRALARIGSTARLAGWDRPAAAVFSARLVSPHPVIW